MLGAADRTDQGLRVMRGNSDQVMPLADADAAIRIYKDFNRILLLYDVRHCFTYLHHKEKANGRQVVDLL